MGKQRVLLVCATHLFSESLETILRTAAEVELIGPWAIEAQTCARILEAHPQVVVVVEKNSGDVEAASLASAILEKYPELPVIRAGLAENIFRVFSMRAYPARGADLLATIRDLPSLEIPSDERSNNNDEER